MQKSLWQIEADRMKNSRVLWEGNVKNANKYLQLSKYLTISHHFSYPPKISAEFAQFSHLQKQILISWPHPLPLQHFLLQI